ncbi:flagellar basal body rod protein FlgB [Gephyromycinifex aptenodytis]|uniref:flagellar basal body rod protein FlgB n=1 Tax=Gephyromycinifex aptenodytis TaxID=2716227 RepID=UPI001445B1A7|nr:flagellar basal body protein [Gephyromycinifex aptenodytis]
MPDLIGDVTMRALSQALTGLSMRQRTIADNMANVDTPGFLAGKVDFESSLKSALADGIDPRTANLATARSLEPTRTNGSNVNLDEESVAGHETVLATQLASLAMTNKFKSLRTAITGSGA